MNICRNQGCDNPVANEANRFDGTKYCSEHCYIDDEQRQYDREMHALDAMYPEV